MAGTLAPNSPRTNDGDHASCSTPVRDGLWRLLSAGPGAREAGTPAGLEANDLVGGPRRVARQGTQLYLLHHHVGPETLDVTRRRASRVRHAALAPRRDGSAGRHSIVELSQVDHVDLGGDPLGDDGDRYSLSGSAWTATVWSTASSHARRDPHIAGRLRGARKATSLSPTDVAAVLKTDQKHDSRVERREHRIHRFEFLELGELNRKSLAYFIQRHS